MSVSKWGQWVDRGFGQFARWRARQGDRQSLAEQQSQTLLRLVRRARSTRFGREHGFDRLRTVQDYRAQVPLREYEDFWREYWQPSFPCLTAATWPGVVPYLALSSGTTSGTTKHIPVSRDMLASNRRAALTSLAWLKAADPSVSLFAGQMFLLGGSTDLKPVAAPGCRSQGARTRSGDLSGIAAREIPRLARPFSYPALDLALMSDWEQKLELLAEDSVLRPITLVGGVPSWLLVLFERLLSISGRSILAEVWPMLRVIVHGGTRFDPYRDLFRQVVGSDQVRFLETYPASEGFVAAEDPRYGQLRLMTGHGIYFEFVPVNELGSDRPTRHAVAEIVPGVNYAVVLTTCAGLWSYVLGDTVTFDAVDPPLLRFTGRTKQFLSAFGEHLIGEEVERAIAAAATATSAAVVDFHVGPAFPAQTGDVGRHRFVIEFAQPPLSGSSFASELDRALCRVNEDYAAHREGDLTLLAPEVWVMPRGGFAEWMRSRGKLGGQHKVPRLDNTGQLTAELCAWHAGYTHSDASARASTDPAPLGNLSIAACI